MNPHVRTDITRYAVSTIISSDQLSEIGEVKSRVSLTKIVF